MAVNRTTISVNQDNWAKIKNVKNRSKVINVALEYYFKAQEFLANKEQEFILTELNHYLETGESYSFEETFND